MINTRQGTYVDGTATVLTAHQWLQSLCHFLGADRPAQRHELMPCSINWSRNRIVTEMI